MRRSTFLYALMLAAIATGGYIVWRISRPGGGDAAYIAATPEQEIALGLHASPVLARRFGGLLQDQAEQARLDTIGNLFVMRMDDTMLPHGFDFHVLSESDVANVLSLPGGQIFITSAMLERLREDSLSVAAMIAHEIGHVISRHSAESLARAEVHDGRTGAVVLATYRPDDQQSRTGKDVSAAIAYLIELSHDEQDEIEADARAVDLLRRSGVDPGMLLHALRRLAERESGSATAFATTHPTSARRLEQLETSTRADLTSSSNVTE